MFAVKQMPALLEDLRQEMAFPLAHRPSAGMMTPYSTLQGLREVLRRPGNEAWK